MARSGKGKAGKAKKKTTRKPEADTDGLRVGPKVRKFQWTKSADQDVQNLSNLIKDDYNDLRKEMVAGLYTPGRDLKQRKGSRKGQPKVWQARLSRSHRATFIFKDGVATFQRIAEHKVFD